MPEENKVRDIEIEQDMAYQEREWKFERAGWVIGLILLAAALAGLFGSGPLSDQTARSGPLEVQYQRFTRFMSPTTLSVQVAPDQIREGQVRIWVDREFLDRYDVRKIVPEPDAAHLMPDRIVYDFQAEQASGPEQAAPFQISFQLESSRMGSSHGQLGGADGDAVVTFSQFVYP